MRSGSTRRAPRSSRPTARRGRKAAGTEAVRDWLAARIRGTYLKGNWAGKGPMPAIEGIDAETAHRSHPEQHTIAEIVLHMAYWKDAVTSRLEDRPWSYDDRLNWRPAAPGAQGWQEATGELAAAQRRLVRALRRLTPERLWEPIRGSVRMIDLVTDIATHDTYHAAQIFVLRRLPATR